MRAGNWRDLRALAFFALAAQAFSALAPLGAARAADRVTLGTDWLAEPEQGGFYQAVADGTYAKYGLDVTIVPGGPQANNQILLPVGKIDFYVGGDLLGPFDAAAQHIPIVAVAAIFQKSPQVVMAHPGVGHDAFRDLKGAPIYLGKEFFTTAFQWMKSAWGFSDEDVRPYTYDPAPFIADARAVQQGYATSEPFAIAEAAHFKPVVFLLDDYGYKTYATLIETRPDLVGAKPDLVRRFVQASAVGWKTYLHGDAAAANAAIKRANPDMTDAQIAFSIAQMKQDGLVEPPGFDGAIGAMTPDRVDAFFHAMEKAGVVSAATDYKSAFDYRFAPASAAKPSGSGGP